MVCMASWLRRAQADDIVTTEKYTGGLPVRNSRFVHQDLKAHSWLIYIVIAAVLLMLTPPASSNQGSSFMMRASSIAIVLDPAASDVEMRVADVLQERLKWYSQVSVEVLKKSASAVDLQIFLGRTGHSGQLDKLCSDHGVKLPGRTGLAPEGYAVKTVDIGGTPAILAVGVDNRGVLYAAGEILRRITYEPGEIAFGGIDVRTAPAFRFRGCSNSQGGSMMSITNVRPWTDEEKDRVYMDFALAGANVFYAGWEGGRSYDYAKAFDIMTESGLRPNEMREEFPEEWLAGELDSWEGKHWVCPTIPEARKALLEMWAEKFETRVHHDVTRMYAGDPGGCRDERCMPWGKTFVYLCEEIADILLKTDPSTIILIANQDVTNAGDQAIFDYLNEKPRTWLYGMCYGPGSNAMSWYFRDELREDLFIYPGKGPVNRYLAETLNQIPKDKKIVHYSDTTHWISAQYAVADPEPHIVKSYGRRIFHARPRAMYRIFQAIMPFSEGDIAYTEGYHSEFHQYMWMRLLWDPNRELEDVVHEYCRLCFGEEAAGLMSEALFQLEENLEAPLATNDGIDRYYGLIKEAGRRIPPHLMEKNHRWLMHMQKAALDKYIQLKLQIELFKEQRIRQALQSGLKSGNLDAAIDKALAVLAEPAETPRMARYREEARQLGEESDQLFGIRVKSYFKLDEPLRDLPGALSLLKEADKIRSKKEKKRLVTSAIETTEKETDVGRIWW